MVKITSLVYRYNGTASGTHSGQVDTYTENAPTITGTTRARKMYEPHFSVNPKESLRIGLNKVSTTAVLMVITAFPINKNITNWSTVKEMVLIPVYHRRINTT